MVAKTKLAIENRLKARKAAAAAKTAGTAVGGGGAAGPATLPLNMPPASAAPARPSVLGTGSRLSALQAKVAALKQKKAAIGATPQKDRPAALLLDKDGKMVDATGKEIKMVKRAADFKVNLDQLKGDDGKGTAAEEDEDSQVTAAFYDERLPAMQEPGTRRMRAFNFHAPGDFVDKANKNRAKAKLEKLQAEIAERSKKTGISSAAKLALMAPFKNDTEDLVVPDTEWWDNSILLDRSYATVGDEGVPPNLKNVTHYIQHPIEIEPPAEPDAPAALPMMLTKKERKKMRTQRRKAEEKEKQEKIRLGLLEAPAPKIKKANFMRVLGVEAVADPTQIENMMKQQVAIRKREHEAANAARAKTKEQKREKAISKLQEDTSKVVHVAVFRINDMKSDSLQYKVDINAKQLYLTGCTLMTNDALNVVVVEGGPKGLKRYKRLMLHRIKWADDSVLDVDDEDDEDDEKPENKCVLVWEGTVVKRAFDEFEMKLVRSESFAREYFQRFGVPHYWDLALTNKVTEDANV